MAIPMHERLRRALDRADIPPHIQREVYNLTMNKAKFVASGADWSELLAEARNVRTNLVSNRARWKGEHAPKYEEYIQAVESAMESIQQASVSTQLSLKEYLESTGAVEFCGPQWQAWIDPKIRASLINSFFAMGRHGNSLRPFDTRADRKKADAMLARHRSTIKNTRLSVTGSDSMYAKADTMEGALMLACCRHAEIALDKWEKAYKAGDKHPYEDRLPAKWTLLLSPELRQRISDYKRTGCVLNAKGLDQWLDKGDGADNE